MYNFSENSRIRSSKSPLHHFCCTAQQLKEESCIKFTLAASLNWTHPTPPLSSAVSAICDWKKGQLIR